MSGRPVLNLLLIVGILLFSVLGYLSLQQYIERSATASRENSEIESIDYDRVSTLPVVKPDELPEFAKAHADGIPVDYLVPARHWPPVRAGYTVFHFNEGCVLNSRPKETCTNRYYVAINHPGKSAILVRTLDDLPKVLARIETPEQALTVAEFISSWEYEQYFGTGFTNVQKAPDNDSIPKPNHFGFYLSEKAWGRLQLPPPQVRLDKGNFHIKRVGFIPFGEKQIVLVEETLTPEGRYTFDIASILYRGSLVPIQVKLY